MEGPQRRAVGGPPHPATKAALSSPAIPARSGDPRAARHGPAPATVAFAFTLCLAPILLGAGLLIVLGPVDPSRPRAWGAILLATLGWWSALALARRVADSWALVVVLVAGAIALRVLFLVSDGELSDDVHRYVWEGALVAEGIDPYAHAPAAPELEAQRARWSELGARVNHPDVPAAYPPLAHTVHAAVVRAAGGPGHAERAAFGLRLLYGSADLLVCWPLAWMLIRRGKPLARLAAWAWNPWMAMEFAGAAHLDALALLLALTALACARPRTRLGTGRGVLVGALLAAGTLVKLLPLALVPFLVRHARRPGLVLLAFGAALALGLLPFVRLTGALPGLGGLGEYAFRWESFNLVHRWIEPLFAGSFAADETWSDPRRLARGVLLLAFAALGLVAWRRRIEPARAAAWLFTGFVVLTPTLHPWYLAWIVPFLALRPSSALAALAGLAPLLYLPLERWRAERVWVEPSWLHPFFAGLLFVLVLRDRFRRVRP